MLRCPRCDSDKIYCVHNTSKWVAWRRKLSGKRPHRCVMCRWYGWGEETAPQFTAEEIAFANGQLTKTLDPSLADIRNVIEVATSQESEARPFELNVDLGEPVRRRPLEEIRFSIVLEPHAEAADSGVPADGTAAFHDELVDLVSS